MNMTWNGFISTNIPAFNEVNVKLLVHSSQLTFTCSKSTIETLEKGVKYVQN